MDLSVVRRAEALGVAEGFQFKIIYKAEDLKVVANEIMEVEAVGVDLETTGLLPHASKIRLCSLNTGKGVYVVDLFETGGLGCVAQALAASKAVKVGQNLKFEQKMLMYHYGIELWPIFDTFRASNILYGGKKDLSHSLKDIYQRELPGNEAQKGDLGGSDWSGSLTAEQYLYSAQDVVHMLILRQNMKHKLVKAGLNRIALIEFQAVLPESSMELNGLYLDPVRWLELAAKHKIQMLENQEKALQILPHPKGQIALPGMVPSWNLRSPTQKLQALRLLGLNIDSTNELVLAMYAAEYPAVKALIAYTKASKMVTSFGESYLKHIDPSTGRIHTNYYPYLVSGRYSSSDPNLQQIPRHKDFRRCFAAPPGRVIVAADYSQIELRVLAEISGDRLLLSVYQQNRDAHRQTAALISDVALEEVTSEMRQYAKPVNFGLCVAAGQRVLTHVGLVPIEEVQDWHLVWDGIEWVHHDGVIFKGYKEVMSYDGLLATPDHEVYTDEGYKIPFRVAASPLYSGRLAVGGIEEVPIRYTAFDRRCREEGEIEGYVVRYDGTKVQESYKSLMPVYDILNAGPKHRFTVEGKIVSNCFGMGAPKLVTYAMKAYGVSMSEKQALRFREKYFQGYYGVREWHRKVVAEGQKTRMSHTLAGRLRYLEEDDYTEYINTPIQGSAADGLKSSLPLVYRRLQKYGGRAKLVHMVHDEIIIETDDDPEEVACIQKDLELGMLEGMQPFLSKVPVVVEGATGGSWGEAH